MEIYRKTPASELGRANDGGSQISREEGQPATGPCDLCAVAQPGIFSILLSWLLGVQRRHGLQILYLAAAGRTPSFRRANCQRVAPKA